MGLGTSVYQAVKQVGEDRFVSSLIIFYLSLFILSHPCTSQGMPMGRTIPNDKPGTIICNNERGIWPLLDIAIL